MTQATLQEQPNAVDDGAERALLAFHDAIERTGNLEITGIDYADGVGGGFSLPDNDVFIIRNHSIPKGVEGAFVEVSIKEIINRAENRSPFDTAQEFINVILNARPPIVLEGVTRIVGYYSRTHNWNKSKVGELRDRANGNYGLTGRSPLFQSDRLKAIDSL